MFCLICNSKNLKNIILKKKTAYKCRNCGVEFFWPQPTKKELNQIYQNDYYKSWDVEGNENDQVRIMKMATSKKYLNLIKKYKNEGRLLDIGCAFGYFLEVAEKIGFDVYGVELSKFSSDIAKNKFGDKIFNGELEEVKFPNENFDVIVMSDLIEHIPEPAEFLKEVKRILKKDGIIVIITPDTASFSRKILGLKNWFHYKMEHLFYYNKKSLNYLLNRFNLEIICKKKGVKAISLTYLENQLNIFRILFFTSIINIIYWLSPSFLRKKNFYLSGGEMIVLVKNKNL